MALVSTSASLTGLRYELVDLDPDDGVTPFVEFTGQAFARAKEGSYCNSISSCVKAYGSFTDAAFAQVGGGSAAVSSAGLFAAGEWGSSSTSPTDRQVLGSRSFEFNVVARYEGVPGQPLFVVSANTGLRITGHYTLDVAVNPFCTPEPLLRGPEYGAAGVFFTSRFIDGPAPGRSISAHADWVSEPVHEREMGEISVLLRNDSNRQATLWGKWGVNVSNSIPDVPEPSTYALMLAGLVVVGATVRRRGV
jgi:hypothetical protein